MQDESRRNSIQPDRVLTALWNHCNLLLEEGLTYDDYAKELGYLLFLKIAEEQTQPPLDRPSIIPQKYAWKSLVSLEGAELLGHYRKIIEALGQATGLPGVIFREAQSKIEDPAQLHQLIMLINSSIWYRKESYDWENNT